MVVTSLFVMLTAIVDYCPNPNVLEVEKCQYSDPVKLHVLARFFSLKRNFPYCLFGYQDV